MSIFSKFFQKKEKLDFLFVGLGNPDKEYLKTRHNIGWMVINKFCESHKVELKENPKLKGFFGVFSENGKKIGLLKPTTYMNRSGKSIDLCLSYYDISQFNIIIIIDEYNLPVGKLQIKIGGSDGGHNGMSSVLEYLPQNEFLRLRCGIDRKFGPGELVDYVLSPFEISEKENLEKMLENAKISMEYLIRNAQSKAISFINSGKLWKKENQANDKNNIVNN